MKVELSKGDAVCILFEKGEVAGVGYTLADTLEGILLLTQEAAKELCMALSSSSAGLIPERRKGLEGNKQ